MNSVWTKGYELVDNDWNMFADLFLDDKADAIASPRNVSALKILI